MNTVSWMNEIETIERILEIKTIAVVGISDKQERPSFFVAKYLLSRGYEIIPVNPNFSEWEGMKCFPDLKSIDKPVDVVDIFRKPEAVGEIVAEAIKIGAKAVWLQEGVINEQAAEMAEKNSLLVVMDRCMKKECEKRA